jgi:hypothetical protein
LLDYIERGSCNGEVEYDTALFGGRSDEIEGGVKGIAGEVRSDAEPGEKSWSGEVEADGGEAIA